MKDVLRSIQRDLQRSLEVLIRERRRITLNHIKVQQTLVEMRKHQRAVAVLSGSCPFCWDASKQAGHRGRHTRRRRIVA